MTYHEIAVKLNRDDRTIWTAYHRAKKKHERLSHGTTTREKVPLDALKNREFSILESVVVYLKEQKSLTYAQIAAATARNDRTIWTVYNRALKKRGGSDV